MGASLPAEENKLKPWADDERLNNPLILGTFNTFTTLIQKFATLAEKLPDGSMPKNKSIPAMWETVKDLKAESLKKLQTAIQSMEEALKIAGADSNNKEEEIMEEINTKKDDEKSERESDMNTEAIRLREAAEKKARDKRRADDDGEIEGVGSSFKERKFKTGFERHPSVNAEGTCIKSIPTTGHCFFIALQSVRSCMNKSTMHTDLVPCVFQMACTNFPCLLQFCRELHTQLLYHCSIASDIG